VHSLDRSNKEGITLKKLIELSSDEEMSMVWFGANIWKDGHRCPKCDCRCTTETGATQTIPYYCRSCYRRFSLRIRTIMMKYSKIRYQN